MPTVINGQPTSKEILQKLADMDEPIVLSFSCGKDSIAAWLAMREYGIEIVPVYFWAVPGLKFVDDSLEYFEDYFGMRIHRYPNPNFYNMLLDGVHQPPQRARVIEAIAADLPPRMTYPLEWELIFDDLELSQDTWKADGVRAADSLVRRSSFVKHGVMKQSNHKVSPIADWLKAEVMGIIEENGVELPIDYRLFGRSFDGIDRRFVEPIRDNLPDDYEKIVEWFPLCMTDSIRNGADPNDF